MNIKLMYTDSENNTIGKRISNKADVTAIIKGSISVENPVLILNYNGDISKNINYVYIEEYNRYYYINDIINLTGGRYEIHCSVDVLESFKDKILKLKAVIDKQKGREQSNLYYDDNSFKLLNKEFNAVINFPNGFLNEGEFILITAGGGGGII